MAGQLAAWLAEASGLIVSPGELYGEAGRDFVRIAVVQPDDRLELAAPRRLRSRPEARQYDWLMSDLETRIATGTTTSRR